MPGAQFEELSYKAMTGTKSQLIDGRLVASPGGFDVINPATEAPFATCPDASRDQLDEAVAAARRAFGGWSALSFAARRSSLLDFGAKILEEKDALAELLTREQGKPLDQAIAEIDRAALHFTLNTAVEPESIVMHEDENVRAELRYRPLGVVGAITPWNVPVGLACAKVSQALFAGNTVVLKPSPYTPLSTLALGELAVDVLPPGVLNIVAGGDDLGRWISEHADIDKISFTGSVATGKKVMMSAAKSLKRLTLELGGNDPAIVLDDADPDVVGSEIYDAAFLNSGQVCMAIKRVYVHDTIYDKVCAAIASRARDAKIGDGLETSTDLGPIQNRMQYDKVVDLLKDVRESGAAILAGGNVPDRSGYFIEPTVVAETNHDSRLVQEEQFGPVLPVMRFDDEDEVVARSNDTRFGLSASVWSGDTARAERLAARLEVGTAWVNQHLAVAPNTPFGGAKESGLGREYSLVGLHGYMEPEVINVRKS